DVGFLGAQVVGGSVSLNAGATVQFPAADFSLAQLQTAPLSALGVTVTGNGSGSVSLPVPATIGGTPVSAAPVAVTFTVADAFAGVPAALGALPDALKVFTNVSPSDILQSLGQLGGWLGDLRGASSLTASLPFLKGVNLGSVLDLPSAL